MNITELLTRLRRLGIEVYSKSGGLKVNAPKGVLTSELRMVINEHEAEIIACLPPAETVTGAELPSIQPSTKPGPFPLSFAQERQWFLSQLDPDSPVYNIFIPVRLKGNLNLEAMERAINEVIHRHHSLRTRFDMKAGQPFQELVPFKPQPLPYVDLTTLPEADRENRAKQLAEAESKHPFNLTRDSLFRFSVIKLADADHLLLLTMHQLIADDWSYDLFWAELAALYPAFSQGNPSPLPELPLQYPDYALWQREYWQGPVLADELEYWVQQLGDDLPVLELHLDHPRPAIQTFNGAAEAHILPAALAEALQTLSQEANVTLFTSLLAAFNVLLYRYTGQEELLIGTPAANRTQPAVEGLIGPFANTLVLRTDLSGQPAFAEFLARVNEVVSGAYRHQDLPFEKLLERLQPERDPSRSPVFQVMVDFKTDTPIELAPGLEMNFYPDIDNGVSPFDLTLLMQETPQGLQAVINYNTDLFERGTIKRMLSHFETLLSGIAANPDLQISQLPLLTEAEQRQLLVTWNQTVRNWPLDQCLHRLFEAQAARVPEAIAVTCGDDRLTYRQLNERANSLARRLVELQVGPEVLVALVAERGIDFLITILAIFKAGGAYLPLDPLHPVERHRQVLGQSRASLALVTTEFAGLVAEALADLPPDERPQLFSLEELLREARPTDNLSPRATPQNLAYVLYTSGSTGLPKGAMVEQVGMLNHIWSKISDLGMTETDILAQNGPQTFDISVWQFLAPLVLGGQVHIFPNEIAFDPIQLLKEVARQRITVLQMVPSMIQAFIQAASLDDGPPPDLSVLRWVVPTGEAFTTELCRRWFATYPNIPALNTYGSTECSDDQCHHPVMQMPPPEFKLPIIPLGRPIPNMQAYVLDSQLKPVPIGVSGEIYIGGIGVGRGYLYDAERTAKAFIPNPFLQDEGGKMKAKENQPDSSFTPQPSAFLYKTGDLGRYLPDGSIEFLGRVDFMVKVRGFRIELGEIEAALSRSPMVQEALVVVANLPDAPDNKYLASYVVPAQGQSPTPADLRVYLQERLPKYMIPAVFVMLKAMPLNNNGKVNRRALPAPDQYRSDVADTFIAPRTPTETVIADTMATLLNLKQVGIYDNFFELGGHSLMGIQIISRLRDSFQIEIPLRSLFEGPTVVDLARLVDVVSSIRQNAGYVPDLTSDMFEQGEL